MVNRSTIRLFFILLFSYISTGCLSYMASSAYNQVKILNSRVPIKKTLEQEDLDPKIRKKLELTLEVKTFAEEQIGLKKTKNYLTYVDLGRPYVTYLLQVAPAFELAPYKWKFPIVGEVPYKGFFSLDDAKAEAGEFDKSKYDTYVRGVPAYSLLGWFDEPVLSSMMRYTETDYVNTIIHETVHATIFIKDNVEFNERLATFVANHATEDFYLKREGTNSPTLKAIRLENEDEAEFSKFISAEIKSLRAWYADSTVTKTKELKEEKLNQIKVKFKTHLKPRLKTDKYNYFESLPLNNALLLSYDTYMMDLHEFEELFTKMGRDYRKFIEHLRQTHKT